MNTAPYRNPHLPYSPYRNHTVPIAVRLLLVSSMWVGRSQGVDFAGHSARGKDREEGRCEWHIGYCHRWKENDPSNLIRCITVIISPQYCTAHKS